MHKLFIILALMLTPYILWACEAENPNEISDRSILTDFHSPRDGIIIAQWNIGHFSQGKNTSSIITGSNFEAATMEYQSIIDQISADLFSINEYSVIFGTDEVGLKHRTDDLIFSKYMYHYIGMQKQYSCNSLFSNYELIETNETNYHCNEGVRISHNPILKAEDYYYIESNVEINGIWVKLITTHLAFDTNNEEVARNQIEELIMRYTNDNFVIMCGDWNVKNINTFDLFKSAGYEMANHSKFGDLATRGGGCYRQYNCKGFANRKCKNNRLILK